MKKFLINKIGIPILNLLKQGVTPQKLALSLSAGVVIGCFPILGTTSILSFIFALVLRLNQVAIQIANYVAYPLQFILIVPFLHIGNCIFGLEPMNFNITEMMDHFQIDWVGFVKTYGFVALRGCVAWAITAPLAGGLLYFIFLPLLKKVSKSV